MPFPSEETTPPVTNTNRGISIQFLPVEPTTSLKTRAPAVETTCGIPEFANENAQSRYTRETQAGRRESTLRIKVYPHRESARDHPNR